MKANKYMHLKCILQVKGQYSILRNKVKVRLTSDPLHNRTGVFISTRVLYGVNYKNTQEIGGNSTFLLSIAYYLNI